MLHKKSAIIISGPTAVGKTSLAIEIAKHFHTKIISADSRQCYKELNIGVAKPSEIELQQVEHFFINSHSIHQNINAAIFENYALEKADEIFKNNNIVVVAGGTGLYIKSFCEGLDEIPETPNEIRKEIIEQYNTNGLEWLQQQVKEKDFAFWQNAEQQNPQRLMRALEVITYTGKSITDFRKKTKIQRPFNILKIGVELPRVLLYERINKRVDTMMKGGLLNEVIQLQKFEQLNALQTVGYKELFAYIHNTCTLEEAINNIKKNTRHYAKRQLTWFKKDKEIQWFQPYQITDIIQVINSSFL
ncbi:MAG: tRNA (adenosine(37)-N6)-dimethylallyltransferase MiaA [Chitinophagales bacterium]|nr:tRNA (adenosine(37)-N6)-dimethylallyltransferase MiaA [Chitinophagales bacterium]